MKLYNLDHSPYATRVRVQITRGALPVEVLPPPVPIRTPEFAARFPFGKIPVLELDDGGQLADSWVIMEYLQGQFPSGGSVAGGASGGPAPEGAGKGLVPEGALERAKMQTLARCADTCFGPGGVFPLFSNLAVPRDERPDNLLDGLHTELARLERLLPHLYGADGQGSNGHDSNEPASNGQGAEGRGAGGRGLHLGDIALAPHVAYALLLAPLFSDKKDGAGGGKVVTAGTGKESHTAGGEVGGNGSSKAGDEGESLLANYPAVAAWWQWVREDTAVAAELAVMEGAAKSFMAR